MDGKEVWDVAVVGAGAAGLMGAIAAAREGARVLLLDGQQTIGAKILMSGGTRCNVTNRAVTEADFESNSKRIVRDILRTFSSQKAVKFFEDLGVSVVLEPGGKYFPSTHSGKTILEVLMREAANRQAVLKNGCKIKKISAGGGFFRITGDETIFSAKTVILSTGGLSYPGTGSDGSGFSIAQSFGHSLVPTTPALTPLETDDADWKGLSGLSLPVRLTHKSNGKMTASFEGPLLFTHFGFSGPAVLNISRYWIRCPQGARSELFSDFLPHENEEGLRAALKSTAAHRPSLSLARFLAAKLPERFAETCLKKLAIPASLSLNQLGREDRERVIKQLRHCPLKITGAVGYRKAEATAGGISLEEVDRRTLESKLRAGLFFAGEMLDVDGRIGGFNFQWAWSSGQVAGRAAAKKSKE